MNAYRVELSYNVLKGTEYFLSLQTSVFLNEECNVMVNSEELYVVCTVHFIVSRNRTKKRLKL
jgi:hypothetical protein